MKELNRATTMANRIPEALSLPSNADGISGTDSICNLLFFVIFVPSVAGSRIPRELRQAGYFPLNTAVRFSRKARVPSVLSSVAQATAKRTASR